LETIFDELLNEIPLTKKQSHKKNRIGKKVSVLRTGLLPQWQNNGHGPKYDLSGFCAEANAHSGPKIMTWQAMNSDQMILVQDNSTMQLKHRVKLAKRLPTLKTYLPFFLSGFRKLYCCLIINKEKLLRDGKMLNAFDSLDLRTLIRSTENYVQLQLHMLHPEFLKDGIDRSIELEWLAKPMCGRENPKEGTILIYQIEREAMDNLDVPRFSTIDWVEKKTIQGDHDLNFLCRKRDASVLKRRLASFNGVDCAKQYSIIKKTVRSRFGK
jgi:lantibiotic modifying enzyme